MGRRLLMMLLFFAFVGGAWAQQTLPYEYGFENGDVTTDGWIANITSSSSGIKSGGPQHSGSYGFAFNYSEENGSLISPLLTGGDNGVEVSFWYKEYSSQYGDEQFQVGYTIDETVTDADDFTYGDIITASLEWQQYQETFPAGTKRIAIKYIYNDAFYLFLDDFNFEAFSPYAKPTDLTVSDLTTEGATISWTAPKGSPTGYTYQYKKVSEENWSEGATINATSIALSGLEAGTAYNFRVKAVYGTDGESGFATINFTLPLCMGGRSIEYTLTDSYGDGWNDASIKVADACGNVVESLTIASGSSNSGVLYLCEDDYQFIWQSGKYDSECSFEFSENGTTLFTKPSSLNNGDVLYTIGTIFPIPTGLTAETPGKNSVVLNWTANGSEAAWEICINGDETNLITASTNENYELSGLEPGTEYTVKVRASIDDIAYSCWSNEITFTTEATFLAPSDVVANNITATTADISWTGDDEATSYNLRYATSAGGFFEDFENGLDRWTVVRNDGGDASTDWRIVNSNTVFSNEAIPAHSGDYVVMSRSYNGSACNVDNWLISPQVDLGGTMTYWVMDDGNYHEHYDIYVSTTTTDLSAFTKIYEPGNASGEWTEHTVNLSAYAGQQGYVAFRLTDYDQDFLFIDDVTITAPSTNIEWTTVNDVTSPYTITDLTPETKYDVEVQAVYEGGSSTWTAASFTTVEKVPMPAGLAATEVETRTAVLSWTERGEATAWEICLNDDEENLIAADSNPFTLTDLTPGTAYTAKVRAIGEDNEKSKWSAAINFTTIALDAVPFNLQTADVTATTATLNWEGVQDSYNVRYHKSPVCYFTPFNTSEDVAGWNYSSAIYGLDDPVYNIPGNSNYFLSMGWSTTEEDFIYSPELPAYPSGSTLEFYHFYYSGENTFQIGYSTTTRDDVDAYTWSEPIASVSSSEAYSAKFSEVLPDGVKYIAFRATASDQGHCIFIDDLKIFDSAAIDEWDETISNVDAATLAITGLDPETNYEWQVQGIYNGKPTEWSEVVTFTTEELNLELANDATDNSETIDTYAGLTAKSVTLAGRTLYKDDKWNTICLPFNVTIEGSVLEGAVARELTDASIDGNGEDKAILVLTFGGNVSTLEAGKPYLIRWKSGEDIENIENPVFEGVTIDNTDRNIIIGSGETRVSFLGNYDVKYFTDDDYLSVLLMGSNNELRYANAKAGLGACRAYFKIGEDDNAARITAFSIDFGDETTGIRSIENESLTKDNDDVWYTLDGRKLEGKPVMKGVYINKGNRIMIK